MERSITLDLLMPKLHVPYNLRLSVVGDTLFISETWGSGYVRTKKENIPAIIKALRTLEEDKGGEV